MLLIVLRCDSHVGWALVPVLPLGFGTVGLSDVLVGATCNLLITKVYLGHIECTRGTVEDRYRAVRSLVASSRFRLNLKGASTATSRWSLRASSLRIIVSGDSNTLVEGAELLVDNHLGKLYKGWT